MGKVGQQEFWGPAGTRCYFIRDGDAYGSMLDLGVIRSVAPQTEATKIQLLDTDGGLNKIADESVTQINETWDLTVANFSQDNLSLLLLGSAPESFVQTATPVVRQYSADIGPNRYIKLLDTDGKMMFNFASATVKNQAGSITYVENTDWRWASKERGLIKVISGGAIAQGQPLSITAVPNPLTGKRLVRPQKGSLIKGQFLLVFSNSNNAHQTARTFDGSIAPSSLSIPADNYADMTLSATVLSDATDAEYPAGTLMKFAGDLPDNS